MVFQTTSTRDEIILELKLDMEQDPKAMSTPIMNIPYGDNSLQPKEMFYTRFLSHNIHGMQEKDEYAKVKEIGEGLLQHQVDFSGFTDQKKTLRLRKFDKRFTTSSDSISKYRN